MENVPFFVSKNHDKPFQLLGDFLQGMFKGIGIKLVDFKLEFGIVRKDQTNSLNDKILSTICCTVCLSTVPPQLLQC